MRWSEEQFQKYQQRAKGAENLGSASPVKPVTLNPQDHFLYTPSEHQEQVAFVQWLRFQGIRHNATPNGGYRAAKTAKYLKAEGVVPGFPDVTVWPEIESGLPIIYIEMKKGRGGKATDEQIEWQKYLSRLPYVKAAICKGAVEAIGFVMETWGLTSRKEFESCVQKNGLSKVDN